MDKRYQVFVSSTFTDLKDERSAVIQTLMKMDCIPAGMELFPAMDEEQFEFIKKVIDDCDYYLLILGARYGTISEGDGLSYTEKEYHYAKEKGMKIIALIHGEPEQLPVYKTDRDPALSEKLAAFRTEVCTGRMVQFWKTGAELPGFVALSLLQTIKTYPAVGWVRGDSTASTAVMTELLSLKSENERLREELLRLESKPQIDIVNLAGLDKKIYVGGDASSTQNIRIKQPWKIEITFADIFKIIAPKLLSPQVDHEVRSHLAKFIFAKSKIKGSSPRMYEDVFQVIKIQFEALGLVSLEVNSLGLYWSLTLSGKRQMTELLAIRE
ncbi:DUF4062 domain-containing protein [Aeromonas caviae]|uniref:DUF4062 domain-containing protein n=1 Tax=Aeromonas caviae TaxID=648 RepID=UPI002B470820|nr:DUF4062 domain-containing protein [Aeromonas caviae]